MARSAGFGASGEAGSPNNPVLITEAARSIEDQHRARVRKYLIIMSFRFPALIFSAAAYGIWGNAWISMAIIGLSIPLPWIAVLIANDRPPRTKDEPSRYDHRDTTALPAPPHRTIEG
ncbi:MULTISPECIES: DUF3099 domain-containing protein [Rhodococcus]|jgi:hypothetical protein|uniref:DUF3099 domain-containing protein n=1 Tax=Rhodococcus oxybenzonivorans TaxID=1990687 RepID=A0A2S2BWM1_9NOCA|nr:MULTISPECIES: DUF3099 domain-containing protein [Rhodococcus]AWK73036.1 hypothetical protein CBI38_17235 [Rhodococcus oxybenzonivorans]MDV7244971.1 DUF3099 domain-containing protein [Rhodococcus oxybenzonivorans]MDV7264904.1 DUF3099 domain-containing protein [Rhodococcus oxybenzonivorans]MDV7278205.1 DUF3099 domain-containing protein [Rhodococcus oxybenzonivorans]MDV7332307.1 DUF3099 domain-containing protein [Rhodococcus oxybenzonivorans]